MRSADSSRASARTIAILTLWGLLAASVAVAEPPDVSNFDCPAAFIRIVGHDGVVGDPLGEYCVTARDFNNVPVPNLPIIIDFSRCDVQLCTDQRDPDAVANCVAQTIRKLTDANGFACFRVIGKRRSVSCVAPSNHCVEVFADAPGYGLTFVCGLGAVVYDLVNEAGIGVTGNDLSEFLHLFFDCGIYLPAIDYNANGVIDGDDLSQFLAGFFSGRSALNCSSAPDTMCP